MIKNNGDWTKKLIDKLYESKKEILKSSSFLFEGIHEDQIFNILLEYDSAWTPEQRKFFYPVVHISRPVTAAAESAAL